MTSPHSIARQCLEDALGAADAAGIDEDRLCKALVSRLLAHWSAARSPRDVRSAVEFELQHMAGEEDIEFMRP